MTAVDVAKVSLSSPLVIVVYVWRVAHKGLDHMEKLIYNGFFFFLSLEDAKMNKIDPGSQGTSGSQGHCCCAHSRERNKMIAAGAVMVQRTGAGGGLEKAAPEWPGKGRIRNKKSDLGAEKLYCFSSILPSSYPLIQSS